MYDRSMNLTKDNIGEVWESRKGYSPEKVTILSVDHVRLSDKEPSICYIVDGATYISPQDDFLMFFRRPEDIRWGYVQSVQNWFNNEAKARALVDQGPNRQLVKINETLGTVEIVK